VLGKLMGYHVSGKEMPKSQPLLPDPNPSQAYGMYNW